MHRVPIQSLPRKRHLLGGASAKFAPVTPRERPEFGSRYSWQFVAVLPRRINGVRSTFPDTFSFPFTLSPFDARQRIDIPLRMEAQRRRTSRSLARSSQDPVPEEAANFLFISLLIHPSFPAANEPRSRSFPRKTPGVASEVYSFIRRHWMTAGPPILQSRREKSARLHRTFDRSTSQLFGGGQLFSSSFIHRLEATVETRGSRAPGQSFRRFCRREIQAEVVRRDQRLPRRMSLFPSDLRRLIFYGREL